MLMSMPMGDPCIAEQCELCIHCQLQGGLVLPPSRHCAAADRVSATAATEVLSHLLLVAARTASCPLREIAGDMPDSYRSADLPRMPLGW